MQCLVLFFWTPVRVSCIVHTWLGISFQTEYCILFALHSVLFNHFSFSYGKSWTVCLDQGHFPNTYIFHYIFLVTIEPQRFLGLLCDCFASDLNCIRSRFVLIFRGFLFTLYFHFLSFTIEVVSYKKLDFSCHLWVYLSSTSLMKLLFSLLSGELVWEIATLLHEFLQLLDIHRHLSLSSHCKSETLVISCSSLI